MPPFPREPRRRVLLPLRRLGRLLPPRLRVRAALLGDVAVEFGVPFADRFYLVDEGFAHCAGLLGLAGVGFGHCSLHMLTSGNDHGSAALAAMASNGNVSSGNVHGSAALDAMASNGIQWH